MFDGIGAKLWRDRARRELDRISGRTPGDRDALTPTERRIAELVATGRTNRDVAAELFITVRTVEANLTRVYSKLDVRSRGELAARRGEWFRCACASAGGAPVRDVQPVVMHEPLLTAESLLHGRFLT